MNDQEEEVVRAEIRSLEIVVARQHLEIERLGRWIDGMFGLLEMAKEVHKDK